MPGLGGTASSTAAPTNTLKSFGGLAPAFPGSGALNTASGILGVATSATPLGAASFAIGTIANIFGAHHQAALKKEGDTLNGAVPASAQAIQQIIAAVNSGQLDPASASSYLDQVVSAYDQAVTGITNNPGATADSAKCNAACFIRVHYLLPWIATAKQLVSQGGTANFITIPSHATQQGYPGFQLTVNRTGGPFLGTSGPISTGLPGGGSTPTALAPLGTPVGNGVVVPFGSQSGYTPAPGAPGAPIQAAVAAPTLLFGMPVTQVLLLGGLIIAGVLTAVTIAGQARG
jgi:hypothetical protein